MMVQTANTRSRTQYAYDALNRLVKVIDDNGAETVYTYDAVGNKIREQLPNGLITQTEYDARNRATRITQIKNNQTQAEFIYTLDAKGQRTQMQEKLLQPGDGINSVPSLQTKTTQWQYDALGRLTQERVQDAIGTHTTTFEHDAVGNVIKKVHDGISTTYTYNENDWLLQQNENGNISTFEYDYAGNLIRERKNGNTITHSYNAKNELIASTSSANTVAYAYDANGIRNSKIVNGSATQFITDANREHAQVVFENSANKNTHYIYGLDLISRNDETISAGNSLGIGAGSSSSSASGATNNAATSYFFYDALGSVKALSNNLGNLTDTYSYNAYGELTQKTGSTANNYLYTGEQYDSESSNYYLRARYYNPSTTRFTQMDTWAGNAQNPITLNKYLYANANPAMYVDPSGNMSLSDFGVAQTGFGNLAAMSVRAYSTGQIVLGSLLRPLINTAATTHVAGAALATLVYTTATNYCQNTENCKLPMPILFYGMRHTDLTKHIQDAQMGLGSQNHYMPALLHRDSSKSRSFIKSSNCDGQSYGGGTGLQCDEYPFSASQEGGPIAYSFDKVSLRPITAFSNSSGGGMLGAMYGADGTAMGDPYLVLANTGSLISFYITRQGKFKPYF